MKKPESTKRLKFIVIQLIIIAPIFLALLVYIKHIIDMNSAKREYRKLVEIEEELYTQHEFLLLKKEILNSPDRIEKIATNKLGFVNPDSITFENQNKINLISLDNEKR